MRNRHHQEEKERKKKIPSKYFRRNLESNYLFISIYVETTSQISFEKKKKMLVNKSTAANATISQLTFCLGVNEAAIT